MFNSSLLFGNASNITCVFEIVVHFIGNVGYCVKVSIIECSGEIQQLQMLHEPEKSSEYPVLIMRSC